MNKGIIYLIQPCELIGTSRYKIGCSKNPDLERCKNGYKKGSRYICIMECDNPIILENKIKEDFDNKFKLIAGNEYYEGNEDEIYKSFIDIINEHKNKLKSNRINEDEDFDEKIKTEFINYYEDEEFGGNKQLLKFIINNKTIEIKYIENKFLCKKIINDDFMEIYIEKLISNQIIENNKIYDFNDEIFINKLNKYKKKLNIKLLQNYKFDIGEYIGSKINYYIYNNSIINDFCCSELKDNHYLLSINDVDTIYSKDIHIFIKKIKNNYYEIDYIRKYIPYQIEQNSINEYYLLNRDYEYIGINNDEDNRFIKRNPQYDNKNIEWTRTALYHDVNRPYDGTKKDIQLYINRYNEIIKNKLCLNKLNETYELLNILKKF